MAWLKAVAGLAAAIAIGVTALGGARSARADEAGYSVKTYLLFDGNCREAMQFYQSVLGGTLSLTSVGESPMAPMFPKALHARIVHARLTNAAIDVPASDWLAAGESPARGNMNALYIDAASPEKARALFDKLSARGKVTAPFAEQPFGWYGRLVDAYGVVWMFHADKR